MSWFMLYILIGGLVFASLSVSITFVTRWVDKAEKRWPGKIRGHAWFWLIVFVAVWVSAFTWPIQLRSAYRQLKLA